MNERFLPDYYVKVILFKIVLKTSVSLYLIMFANIWIFLSKKSIVNDSIERLLRKIIGQTFTYKIAQFGSFWANLFFSTIWKLFFYKISQIYHIFNIFWLKTFWSILYEKAPQTLKSVFLTLNNIMCNLITD